MGGTGFDDLEDPAFAAGSFTSPEQREEERKAAVAKAAEAAATLANWEPCAKCRGTGWWGSYRKQQCFACQGSGKRKPGANARSAAAAKGKETAIQNARARAQMRRAEFEEKYPAEWKWLKDGLNRGDSFAESLLAKLDQYGSLTENQLQAIRNSIARGAAREEERKAAVAIDLSGLVAVFDAARANGAKVVSIRTEHVTFSLARANSTNPAGTIYAKARGGDYLGKIIGGKLTKSFACTPAHVEQIAEAARDPKGAALRYAAATGECSICGAELTDKNSIAAGIGPICAAKFGW